MSTLINKKLEINFPADDQQYNNLNLSYLADETGRAQGLSIEVCNDYLPGSPSYKGLFLADISVEHARQLGIFLLDYVNESVGLYDSAGGRPAPVSRPMSDAEMDTLMNEWGKSIEQKFGPLDNRDDECNNPDCSCHNDLVADDLENDPFFYDDAKDIYDREAALEKSERIVFLKGMLHELDVERREYVDELEQLTAELNNGTK
jgi:hypothetical protein